MIASAEGLTNTGLGQVRQLVGEVDGDLTGPDDGSGALRGAEVRQGDIKDVADDELDFAEEGSLELDGQLLKERLALGFVGGDLLEGCEPAAALRKTAGDGVHFG